MAWNLQITGPAQKEFRRLPAKDQARVKDAMLAMQQDPFSGDIKRLKGQAAGWRRRVGNLPHRLRFPRRGAVDCGGRNSAPNLDHVLDGAVLH